MPGLAVGNIMNDNNPSQKTETSATAVSRRELFHIIGSAPAIAAAAVGSGLAQTHTHTGETPAAKAPYQRKVFDDHQWHTVRVLCDLIMPADERSGSATQAAV